MPQASTELQLQWGGESGIGEDKAVEYLESQGYVLGRDWVWRHKDAGHVVTLMEASACAFLFHEWDFGGIDGADWTVVDRHYEQQGHVN